jgi:hypothetical protein
MRPVTRLVVGSIRAIVASRKLLTRRAPSPPFSEQRVWPVAIRATMRAGFNAVAADAAPTTTAIRMVGQAMYLGMCASPNSTKS